MKTSNLLRTLVVTSVFGAALSANAVVIGLESQGKLVSNSPTAVVDETVKAQEGGFGVLSTLHMDIVNVPGLLDGTATATGTYTGPGGTLNIAFDFNYYDTTGIFPGDSEVYGGRWTATGGTGTYLDATGGGTFVTNATVTGGPTLPSFTTLRGDIQAVPEPASMIALGAGAVGLLRRRRKA